MQRFILAMGLMAACMSGCSRSNPDTVKSDNPPPAVQLAGTAYGDFVIGEPITHENLTIFPISSKVAKDTDRYITLDEGLASGSVKVIEVGAESGDAAPAANNVGESPNAPTPQSGQPQEPPAQSDSPTAQIGDENPFGCEENEAAAENAPNPPAAELPTADDLFGPSPANGDNDANDVPFRQTGRAADVNKLMVLNTSGKPLYLMPGEIITGGNQDRTIGQEIVIDSSDKPVPIDVFCVEQGRWGGRGIEGYAAQLNSARAFDSNLSLVVSQTGTADVDTLAKEAQSGKFVASLGSLSKDGRLAVQQEGVQGRVWDEVAKQNSKVGNDSSSSNFAENYASKEVSESVEPFVKKLMPASETTQIVGVAVAVNGKMLSVDVFESSPLFKKFWPKLLKSYALDAVGAKSDKTASDKPSPISVDDCIAFLNEMEKSKSETVELAGGHKIDKRDSTIGASFSYYDPKAAPPANQPAAGFGGGGFGGGVHTNVLAK
jgi:hypothetical protein